MLFFSPHRAAIVEHARKIVDAATTSVPETSRRVAARRKQRGVERALLEAVRFADQSRLGFYAKARLANMVKWGLHDRGVPAERVDELVGTLVLSFRQPIATP